MPRFHAWAYFAALMLCIGACSDTAPPAPQLDASLDAGPDRDAGPRDGSLPDLNAPDAPGCVDDDGDGRQAASCGGDDCDDTDSTRYPGATEMCDLDDEDCNETTYGADADGDSFESIACCNGVGNCGPDCDDALNTVNPGAAEQCNGGIDDDCDGLADSADGVCAPCAAGYAGFDGDCTNIDECAEGAPCGGAVGAICTDTLGSYTCTCPAGYTGAAAGGTCVDVDECTTSAPCGVSATSCTNTPGSYVCACVTGYSAPSTGGACADVDECATASTCGGGRAGCANTAGSYVCACAMGYAAPAMGGACVDVDECATSAPCGVLATACINTVGSYACSCLPGYGAPTTGGTCADLDECALGTCGAAGVVTSCVNTAGSYACTCAAGYTAPASGAPCVDINECALGTPCGAGGMGCVNSAGGYACTCNAGYTAPATGGTCADVNECTLGAEDCDLDPPAVCANTVGTFTCACPAGFGGGAAAGHGVGGCLLSDAALSSLAPSAGTLGAAFASATTTYILGLPPGATSVTLTPSVAYPARATITVDGVAVASGAASAPISLLLGFAPRPVAVTVTTESGATRTYTVVVGRGSTYVKASNTGAGDLFGYAVALSSDGSTLAIGAYAEFSSATGVGGDQTSNTASDAGAVYVFSRAGAVWSQRAYVKASNTDPGDRFGVALALSADGSTLAVGAVGEDSTATGVGGDQTSNAALDSGAVYVFTRAGAVWSQQAYVKASNTGGGDGFGYAVALSSDGSTLAVSAWSEDSSATGIGGDQTSSAAASAGAVYVLTRAGAVWSQQAYVKASNTGAFDVFGAAIALSSDGSTLAVGARNEDSSATGIGGDQTSNAALDSGAVYVFTRAGAVWSQQAYAKASNTDANDQFGYAVALSSDGSTLAVGAYLEDSSATGIGGDQTSNAALDSGAVYVFTRTGAVWSQQAYVKASNTDVDDRFGVIVALSSNGSALAVGAYREDSSATRIGGDQTSNAAPDSGAVYVFTRVVAVWSQQAYVKASNTDATDQFGLVVALSPDGSTLAVGAQGEASSAIGIGGSQTSNAASRAGAVYVY